MPKLTSVIARTFLLIAILLVNTSVDNKPKPLTTDYVNYVDDVDYKLKFQDALDYFYYDEYGTALKLFLQLLAYDPNNNNLNYYIGTCYLYSSQPIQTAIPYLEKAVQQINKKYSDLPKETQAPILALMNLGDAYLLNYEFEKARNIFLELKTYVSEGKKEYLFLEAISKRLKQADNAIELMQNQRKNISIVALDDVINTTYNDYSPCISADGKSLIFGSQRKGNLGGQRLANGCFMDDIYSAVKNNKGWNKPTRFSGRDVNTASADILDFSSYDGRTIIFHRLDKGNSEIYYTEATDAKGKLRWGMPKLMPKTINSKDNELNACLSADNKTLYFVSDRRGGYGGKDIYMSKKINEKEWGKPVNLGATINTAEDEDFPVIQSDGVSLYFSSKGHYNMGGYDIFLSTVSADGSCSQPENLGVPINTPFDDSHMAFTADGSKAYFSSARNRNPNISNIFEVTFSK